VHRFALVGIVAACLCQAACLPARRSLDVNWTFGGQTCAVAGVTSVRVNLDGEDLSPDTFPCVDGGTVNTGAYLGDFQLGDYLLTVDGLDADGNVLYEGQQEITVLDQRDNVVDIDVKSGGVVLDWTFDGKGCAAAGVDTVHVALDGQLVTDERDNPDLPCSSSGHDGVTISPIDPGVHSFNLSGYTSNAVAYTLSGLQVTVVSGQLLTTTAALLSATQSAGSASLVWTFAGMSCATAQVSQVQILVDGVADGIVPCNNGAVDGAALAGLAAGQHSFKLVASRTVGGVEELVYLSQTAVTADLVNGLTTSVVLDAPAASPGRGGATLTWKFPAGGPDCTVTTGAGTPISYTLTDPTGAMQAAASATCGGASGGASIAFCNPAAGGCAASDTGLLAGNWTLTASVAGTPTYSARLVFGVPDAATGAYDVTFTSP
jgi:hypothetical protein